MATHISLDLTGDTRVRCLKYTDHGPILMLSDDGLSLTMSPKNHKNVQPEDVHAARALLAAVVDYVDQCQRWCPESEDADGTVVVVSDSPLAKDA
jgi:hypothetical protein